MSGTLTLEAVGAAGARDVDIAEAALLLSAAARPELDPGPYRRHLEAIALAAARTLDRESAAECDPRDVAIALGRTLGETLGYAGDRETYDDLKNADIAHVIDRRRGLPVALGILYIHAARSLGASAHGLNFPGHFLVGLGTGRGNVVIDPFHGGRLVDADDLEQLAPPGVVVEPETLSVNSDRGVLARLQNNILTRARQAGDKPRMAGVLKTLAALVPEAASHRFELGQVLADLEQPGAAGRAVAEALALEPDAPWAAEAKALAARLARSLN